MIFLIQKAHSVYNMEGKLEGGPSILGSQLGGSPDDHGGLKIGTITGNYIRLPVKINSHSLLTLKSVNLGL